MAPKTVHPNRYIIYRVTCSVTGKSYVGLTGMPLVKRWQSHVWVATKGSSTSVLHHAIRAHGVDAFSIEALRAVRTRQEACVIERDLIRLFRTISPLGYNITAGGDGGPTRTGMKSSPETCERISRALTGRRIAPDVVERVNAKLRGRKLAPWHAAIIRVAGRKNKGRKHSRQQTVQDQIKKRLLYLSTPIINGHPPGCHKSGPKFRARITIDGHIFDLGSYATMAEASAVYRAAAEEHLSKLRREISSG